MIERIIVPFFSQTLNQNLKTADKAHLNEPFICVCAPWRTKCQETFGKMSNFKSFTWTEWDFSDLWLILNSPGTHLVSQNFAIHIGFSTILYIFLRKFVFFCVCVQYTAESPWFVVSLLVWCFQIHVSCVALETDLLMSSCETFLLSTRLLGMTCDIWETFTFVGCDVCWILLHSKDF